MEQPGRLSGLLHVIFSSPSKESIYNSLIYISSTASALDSGIYRYPPFSIFSFMVCLTASGVTAASRTVSTVCERRVSTPYALTFAADCGTVELPTEIVVDVSDVLAGACTLADELPVGLFFVI